MGAVERVAKAQLCVCRIVDGAPNRIPFERTLPCWGSQRPDRVNASASQEPATWRAAPARRLSRVGPLAVGAWRTVAVCLLLVAAADLGAGRSILDRINEIETAAIAAGSAVKSGHVAIDVYGRNGQGKYAAGYDVYFSDRYLRAGRNATVPGSPPRRGVSPKFTCMYVRGPDRSYFYTDKVLADGGTVVLSVDDREDEKRGIWCVPDARLFGMSPLHSNSFCSMHLDSFLESPHRSRLAVSDGTCRGHKCSLVSYHKDNIGVSVREWICPELGFSVLRMSSEFDSDGVRYVNDSETINYSKASGVWFPSKMVYTRHRKWSDDDPRRGRRPRRLVESNCAAGGAHNRVDARSRTYDGDVRIQEGRAVRMGRQADRQGVVDTAQLPTLGAPRIRWWFLAANLFALAIICTLCCARASRTAQRH